MILQSPNVLRGARAAWPAENHKVMQPADQLSAETHATGTSRQRARRAGGHQSECGRWRPAVGIGQKVAGQQENKMVAVGLLQ